MISATGYAIAAIQPMPPQPESIILVLASFVPLFSACIWLHEQVLLLGAILSPGSHTVSGALRVMGLAMERHFTNYHPVLNWAIWSARHGSRILLGLLSTFLVPPGVAPVIGADDTVERQSGRKIRTKGCYRDAMSSTKQHAIRCFGLKWVLMMLLFLVPWSRRGWALPFLTALRWHAALYHPPGPQPQANAVPHPGRGDASGACRAGPSVPIRRGRRRK
jgi:hypothetical protein